MPQTETMLERLERLEARARSLGIEPPHMPDPMMMALYYAEQLGVETPILIWRLDLPLRDILANKYDEDDFDTPEA